MAGYTDDAIMAASFSLICATGKVCSRSFSIRIAQKYLPKLSAFAASLCWPSRAKYGRDRKGPLIRTCRTGQIEILAHELETLNDAETPPFHHDEQANEELRLKYRYLDLRREGMLGNLRLRHAVTRAMRNYLDEQRIH